MALLDRLRGRSRTSPARLAVIMPWGRVGSNLLMAQLRDSFPSRATRISNEPLNLIKGRKEQSRWMHSFYSEASEDELLVASKHGLLAIEDVDDFAGLCEMLNICVLRHHRRNLIKVAVSQQRAELYATRSAEQDGKAQWGVLKGKAPLGAVALDPGIFVETLCRVAAAQEKFDAFAPDCPTYELEYETLRSDPLGTGRDVMRWLGLEPQREIALRFDKATPDRLVDAVPNLDTLRAAAAGAGFADFEPMFDE